MGLCSAIRPNSPVDRRKYNLFQSAVKAVSKVVWIETEGKDQEHQECYNETCDDRMTFEENADSNAQLILEPTMRRW